MRMDSCDTRGAMNEPEDSSPAPQYRWPWVVLAAFLLGVVLAVVWMSYAVRREREQRNFSAPLPGQAPANPSPAGSP